MHYVYILVSEKDGRFYIGYTNNLRKRVEKHNAKKVQATAPRTPLKLIYYEAYLDEDDAKKRELFLKSGWGRNYIKKNLTGTIKKAKI